VSQPFSSAAVAALFASLYPDHDWLTIPRQSPAIRVAKLPAVLAGHGYRTAFIHSGCIDYDGELEFLENDGFQQVIARATDDDQPRDDELVPAALSWINQHRDHPFFLTLWTRDSHNPYYSHAAKNYTNKFALNRYLNAVAWTDQVAGILASALKHAGLLENTLLVITGDHGEAFEEHGQSVHNFSVYNEEVRIPLMFVSEKLIPHRCEHAGASDRYCTNSARFARHRAARAVAGYQPVCEQAAHSRISVFDCRRFQTGYCRG
jgi:lipoteichoic acid synthase